MGIRDRRTKGNWLDYSLINDICLVRYNTVKKKQRKNEIIKNKKDNQSKTNKKKNVLNWTGL